MIGLDNARYEKDWLRSLVLVEDEALRLTCPGNRQISVVEIEEQELGGTTGLVTAQASDWLHDKFEDDPEVRRPANGPRNRRVQGRQSPNADLASTVARLRVENIHYDLTEDDLDDLFNRIAPVQSISLRFDRAGRSTGTAFVTYSTVAHARSAIREFDGANANGQPIRLSLLPSGPSGGPRGIRDGAVRNPFDSAVQPGRSLFDRIEEPRGGRPRERERERERSRSPGAPRRTDTRKPPPEGVDRYVPDGDGGRLSRSRSPIRPRGRNDNDRRNGDRDTRGGGGRGHGGRGDGGRLTTNGKPRMTQEELDRDMDAYWGSKDSNNVISTNDTGAAANGTAATSIAAPAAVDEDIDMVE
ncbi:hypothetical protein MMC27_006380 [Xylographa pallens]|nr:hypothetical protein [Xylographa pallens]